MAYLIAASVWLFLVIRNSRIASVPILLLLAVGMRLPLILAPPALSGDVYRYLWDGRVGESGINPYDEPPASPVLKHLEASWHPHINHPGIRTIYPPMAQMVFTLFARVSHSVTGWKLTLLVADVITILLLYRLSARGALAYATSPLVLVEGFWSGHLEVLVTCLLVGAVLLLKRNPRSYGAAAVMAAATGLKLTPMAALPGFIRAARNRIRFAVFFVAVLVLPAWPYLSSRHFMSGLETYAKRWSFNSPIYDALDVTVRETGFVVALGWFWSVAKDALRLEMISGTVYRHLYVDFVVRCLMALLLLAGLWLAYRSERSLIGGSASMIGTLLLFSPTIHPWYWVPVLALAIIERQWMWILLASLSPVSYLLYDGGLPGRLVAYVIGYGIPFAAAAVIVRRQQAKEMLSS